MLKPMVDTIHVTGPSERVKRIMEAARVAQMVDDLPELVFTDALHPVAQQACLEAFYVHVRALIEFLGVVKARDTDFSGVDLAPTWTSPSKDSPTGARLSSYWQLATKQLMHFSDERVQAPAVAVSPEVLTKVADDVLGVWDDFAAELRHPMAPMRSGFDSMTSREA